MELATPTKVPSGILLRTVVVLFHPNDDAIAMVLSLARDGREPVAVVNAAAPARVAVLHEAGVELVFNDTNIGLAAAFNQGIARALESGATYVMLLDQDTRPSKDMADRLLKAAARVEASGRQLGCIGPVPVDRKRPQARTLAARVGGQDVTADLLEVVTLISSGMVIPRTALDVVGGMWNELFIDHLDHEWCFRARAAGFSVVAATAVDMEHDMGDRGFILFGRYKPVQRSPLRHYYLVRNTLWLARCSFIPARWRMAEAVKLVARIPSYLLFTSDRGRTLAALPRALRDGLRKPPGRTLSAPALLRSAPDLPPKKIARSIS